MPTKINTTEIVSGAITSDLLANNAVTASKIDPSVSLSGGPKVSTIQIANSSYTILNDTAANTSGGYAVITGSGFASGCSVLVDTTVAPAVSFVSSTTLNVQLPAKAAGTYTVYVVNSDGGTAIRVNAINYSNTPTWITTSPLTQQESDTLISIQFSANSDTAVTYSVQTGSTLPSGLSLAANGLLSGTVTGLNDDTTYNFTIEAIDAELQDTPKAFSVTVTAGDSSFANVTLLMTGDAVANSFVRDFSNNKFAVTINGDTRPYNFSPYEEGYYSNYFDGNGDYLTFASNTAFSFGTGDFTIECWFYLTSTTDAYRTLISIPHSSGSVGLRFGNSTSYNGLLQAFILGSTAATVYSVNKSQSQLAYGWQHVAFTRSGTTCRVFVNGLQENVGSGTNVTSFPNASFTDSTSITNNATNEIGRGTAADTVFVGYMSGVRILKGTALYTSNFTRPDVPLTAIANTQLLTCQSNRFVDNSNNAFTVTKNGDVSVKPANPFAANTSFAVYGSAYFDGNGDYLSITDASAFDFSGDFTVEGWYNFTQVNQTSGATIFVSTDTLDRFQFYTTADAIQISLNGSAVINTTYASAKLLGVWTHIAVVRTGSTVALFVNGSRLATATSTFSVDTSILYVGVQTPSRVNPTYHWFNGYISNFRTIKGAGPYDATLTTLTLPTAPLTAVSNTSLLTLQTNGPINNNTFLDKSNWDLAITRNGNVTQGTFTPYANNYSVYFDGNGDYLSVADNAALDVGSGSFTIESWIYLTSANTAAIISKDYSSPSVYQPTWRAFKLYAVVVNGVFTKLTLDLFNSTTYQTFETTGITLDLNKWYHIAAVRNSNSLNIYVNGTSYVSGNVTIGTVNDTAYPVYIGVDGYAISGADPGYKYFPGYISNVRLVKGTAVYTSNFTPSTSNLTNIANTSLLTCQSNRFVDNSNNAFSITRNGDAKVQKFAPFKENSIYSETLDSGSMYFDGTGDYLGVTEQTSSLAFGSGDFTIEYWIYYNSVGTNIVYDGRPLNTGSTTCPTIYIDNGVLKYYVSGATRITGPTLTAGQWYNIAISRSGTSTRMFVNGVQQGATWTDSTAYTNSAGRPLIGSGSDALGNYVNGYISNLRVTKGQALYTANTTVYTTPVTTTANTVLLLNGTSGGIIDWSMNNDLETVGDVKLNSNIVKYGNNSIYFDGTGDYLTIPSSPNFQFGANNFTIEGWFNFAVSTSGAGYALFAQGTDAFDTNQSFIFSRHSGNKLRFIYTDNGAFSGAKILDSTNNFLPTTNTWYHLAVTREGSTFRLFIDGTVSGSNNTFTTAISTSTRSIVIGSDSAGGLPFNGYISDLRVTKGVARYTSNFTPPTKSLPTR